MSWSVAVVINSSSRPGPAKATLVVWGAADRMMTPDYGREYAAAIAASKDPKDTFYLQLCLAAVERQAITATQPAEVPRTQPGRNPTATHPATQPLN